MRYLVVGYGNIGAKRKRVLGDRCEATVDPFNPAADFRDPSAVPSERYDAAILAVPHRSKLELAKHFLGQGKHVLIEKPLLFPDSAAAGELQRLARAHRAIWYTSYNHRFEPQVVALKRSLDEGALGPLYHARLLYGNGTVQNLVGGWRDEGGGVLEDLGCHLIDLAGYLFGCRGEDWEVWARNRFEAKSVDHCILATGGGRIVLECSWVTWKNAFAIEAYGERGSVHVHGLCKWGPSELIVRQRTFPSGVPHERRRVVEQADDSWAADLEHFEHAAADGESSWENDVWISSVVQRAASVPLG